MGYAIGVPENFAGGEKICGDGKVFTGTSFKK
jgi:hypothetical protein